MSSIEPGKIAIRGLRKEEGVEKRTFLLSKEAVQDFGFLQHLFEATGETNQVDLPEDSEVRDSVLEKVIEFLEYRVAHPELRDEMNERAFDRSRTDNLHEWDETFINGMDKPTLFRLIRASNTLEIKPLIMVASKRLANLIKYMTTEQIRTEFAIPDELQGDVRLP